MTTATISAKGQVTIAAEVLKALSVGAGDRLEFVQIEPGQFLLVAANRSVTELRGMFGKPVNEVSIEDMGRTISSRWASASSLVKQLSDRMGTSTEEF